MTFRYAVAIGIVTMAATARVGIADVGLQAGVRAGADVYEHDAPSVGIDARLSFTLSPLTIALSFDHYFVDEGETLQQIGLTALYDVPIAPAFVRPYGGIGVGLTRFGMPEGELGVDASGARGAVNFIGGARFDHPSLWRMKPFVQAMLSVGNIDLFTVGGGILFDFGGGR
jgi:hypothetical protein